MSLLLLKVLLATANETRNLCQVHQRFRSKPAIAEC